MPYELHVNGVDDSFLPQCSGIRRRKKTIKNPDGSAASSVSVKNATTEEKGLEMPPAIDSNALLQNCKVVITDDQKLFFRSIGESDTISDDLAKRANLYISEEKFLSGSTASSKVPVVASVPKRGLATLSAISTPDSESASTAADAAGNGARFTDTCRDVITPVGGSLSTDVGEAVTSRRVNRGIVPIDNSLQSTIHRVPEGGALAPDPENLLYSCQPSIMSRLLVKRCAPKSSPSESGDTTSPVVAAGGIADGIRITSVGINASSSKGADSTESALVSDAAALSELGNVVFKSPPIITDMYLESRIAEDGKLFLRKVPLVPAPMPLSMIHHAPPERSVDGSPRAAAVALSPADGRLPKQNAAPSPGVGVKPPTDLPLLNGLIVPSNVLRSPVIQEARGVSPFMSTHKRSLDVTTSDKLPSAKRACFDDRGGIGGGAPPPPTSVINSPIKQFIDKTRRQLSQQQDVAATGHFYGSVSAAGNQIAGSQITVGNQLAGNHFSGNQMMGGNPYPTSAVNDQPTDLSMKTMRRLEQIKCNQPAAVPTVAPTGYDVEEQDMPLNLSKTARTSSSETRIETAAPQPPPNAVPIYTSGSSAGHLLPGGSLPYAGQIFIDPASTSTLHRPVTEHQVAVRSVVPAAVAVAAAASQLPKVTNLHI